MKLWILNLVYVVASISACIFSHSMILTFAILGFFHFSRRVL